MSGSANNLEILRQVKNMFFLENTGKRIFHISKEERRCMILVDFITDSILYYWLKIAFFLKNNAFLVLQEVFGHDLKELII
jgi:hypothetical protein